FSAFVTLRLPVWSTLFPYTTLFRSLVYSRTSMSMVRAGWVAVVACMTLGAVACKRPAASGDAKVGDRFVDCRAVRPQPDPELVADRKSTRLNSSHVKISYAVFCLKK